MVEASFDHSVSVPPLTSPAVGDGHDMAGSVWDYRPVFARFAPVSVTQSPRRTEVEMNENGYDEALLLDAQGFVAEGSGECCSRSG